MKQETQHTEQTETRRPTTPNTHQPKQQRTATPSPRDYIQPVTLLGMHEFHPNLLRSGLFSESVELDINVVIHVCDGLLFGLSVEIQQIIEHLPLQTMMRLVGQLAQLDDQILLLGRSDRDNSSWLPY